MKDDARLHNHGPRSDLPAQHDADRRDAGLPLQRSWTTDPTMRGAVEGRPAPEPEPTADQLPRPDPA